MATEDLAVIPDVFVCAVPDLFAEHVVGLHFANVCTSPTPCLVADAEHAQACPHHLTVCVEKRADGHFGVYSRATVASIEEEVGRRLWPEGDES